MRLLGHHRVGERRWYSVLIFLVVCSLTFSLATRFWVPSASQSHTAKSLERRSVDPKRQHLDKSSTQWVLADGDSRIIEPARIEICLAPAGPMLPKHVFSDSLYNRPPPSSGFLL